MVPFKWLFQQLFSNVFSGLLATFYFLPILSLSVSLSQCQVFFVFFFFFTLNQTTPKQENNGVFSEFFCWQTTWNNRAHMVMGVFLSIYSKVPKN
jgi:hypothetical protein